MPGTLRAHFLYSCVYNYVMEIYDELTAYLRDNPGTTSMAVADYLGINLAKAIYELNELAEGNVVLKSEARSPTNNRIVIGYTLIDGFDEVHDNPDGSMPVEEVLRVSVCMGHKYGFREMVQVLETANDWRRKHGVLEISLMEVLREYRHVYGSAAETQRAYRGGLQSGEAEPSDSG